MLTSPSDSVAAVYFDGHSATRHPVTLTRDGQALLLHGAGLTLRQPLDQVAFSERLGNTPRLLRFDSGGHCEVSDHAGLARMLGEAGRRSGWLDHLQHSPTGTIASVLLLVLIFVLGYRYLLPAAAEQLAMNLPETALQQLSGSTLTVLDRTLLEPSRLDPQRQQAILASYARLKPPHGALPQHRVVFRHSAALGANAFALPDGNVVVLDGLVELTTDDQEVVAVLTHELGHVERRHSVRILLQSSVVGLVLTWYVGDISALIAAAPTMLIQAKYSRDMESEADDYAASMLRLNGLSGCLLSAMLEKLAASQVGQPGESPVGKMSEAPPDYLASHPAPRERIQTLCPAR